MSTLGDLTVRIGADDSQFKDTMAGVTDKLKSFASDAFTVAKDLVAGVSTVFTAAGLSDKIFDTHAVDALKMGILELATSTKTVMADVAGSVSSSMGSAITAVESSAAAAAASVGRAGIAAGEAAGAGIKAGIGAGFSGAMAAVQSGLGSLASTVAPIIASVIGGAVVAAAVAGPLMLTQQKLDEITQQAIQAAQTGQSFQQFSFQQNTMLGAGARLGVGNQVQDLFGGMDAAQIQDLVTQFQALPDPIDRAALAVKLFGDNAAQALPLINQQLSDAVSSAYDVAQADAQVYDQATRESLQRIGDFFQSVKDFLATSIFDWRSYWDSVKNAAIVSVTSIESAVHNFATANPMTTNVIEGLLFGPASGLGLGPINPAALLSNAQMDAIMKNAGQAASAAGNLPANLAQQLANPQVFQQAKDSIDQIAESLSAEQTKLAVLQAQWLKDPANAILAQQLDTQQALVDRLQAEADATAAAAAQVKALAGAYSTLGVTDFGKLLSNTYDPTSGNIQQLSGMNAFNALADKLGGPQLAQAASNLEDKLQQAFDAGALSAEQFNLDLDKIEGKLNAARDAGVDLGEKLINAFQAPLTMMSSFGQNSGFVALDGQIATVSTDLDNAHQHLAQFLDLQKELALGVDSTSFALLKSTLDQINVDVSNFDSGLLHAASEAYALGGAMQATFQNIGQTLSSTQAELFKATVQVPMAAVVSLHDELAKEVHISATDSVQTMIDANAKIQASNDFTAQAKLQSEKNTLQAIIVDEEQAGNQASADQEARLSKLKDLLSGQTSLWSSVNKEVTNIFSTMSGGLTHALFDWQNFGKDIEQTLSQIGQAIVKDLIDNLLLTKDNMRAVTSGFTNLLQSFGIGGPVAGGGGSVGDIAGGAAAAFPGGPLSTLSGDATQAASAASAGGGLGGILGSLGSVMSVVGVAVNAISGIVQGFQTAHTNNLLGEIEVTTRKIDNVVEANTPESIFGYTKLSWQSLQIMIGELSDLHNDNAAILSAITAGGAGGGGGGSGDLSSLISVLTAALGGTSTSAPSTGTPGNAPGTLTNMNFRGPSNLNAGLSQLMSKRGGLPVPSSDWINQLPGLLPNETADQLTQFWNSIGIAQQISATGQYPAGTPGRGPSSGGADLRSIAPMDLAGISALTDANPYSPYANNPASTGGASWNSGFTQSAGSAYTPSPGESQVQFIQRSAQFTPDGGYDLISPFGFPVIHIGLSSAATVARSQVPPTPANLVPTMPNLTIGSNYGGPNLGGGAPGGVVGITVNALNPSSRGVADGIVLALRQIGVKVS